MFPSRSLDAGLAAIVSLAVVATVMLKGDALFVGVWYYVTVPLIFVGMSAALSVRPLFLLGVALALSTTFFAYLAINWRAARPEGMLVLGHLFSLPGAAIAVVITALVLKRFPLVHPVAALISGYCALIAGFLLNQLLVCNSLIWCGAFSLGTK